jgi:hypothetical protein
MMTRVLLVGYDPETVDYSNLALPPGMSAERIRTGVALALKQITDREWEGDVCYIRPGWNGWPDGGASLGFRKLCLRCNRRGCPPPQSLAVFEAVLNAIHRAAPAAAIAFNTRPEDSVDAAARWLPPG